MSWHLKNSEFHEINTCAADRRYEYFILKIAEWEELWSLKSDKGFAVYRDTSGIRAIPFWPHAKFADDCAFGIWKGYHAAQIELNTFIQKWLPGMSNEGLSALVFQTDFDRGILVDIDKLDADIGEQLKHFEMLH